jgi:hypothetical protein
MVSIIQGIKSCENQGCLQQIQAGPQMKTNQKSAGLLESVGNHKPVMTQSITQSIGGFPESAAEPLLADLNSQAVLAQGPVPGPRQRSG